MSLKAIVLPLRRVVFTTATLGPDVLRQVERMGGTIQDGVSLTYDPERVHAWTEGARMPDAVLARSLSQPRHYEVFRFRKELDPSRFEEIGISFSRLEDPGRLLGFLHDLARFDDLARQTDETETPEFWEQIHRSLARRG